jgi:hypothetical protein
MPDLDQQKQAARTGGSHREVRDVSATTDAYRLFAVYNDFHPSGQ